MTEYLSPGVYLEEVSYRSRSIEGVSTSTTGFVGTAPSGPIETAVRVRGFAGYARAFGDPAAASNLGFAVRQFFANGGSDAWVVRAAPDGDVATALGALDRARGLALLCVPGEADPQVLGAALRYADLRRAFLIVDPPGPDPTAAVNLARDLAASGSANAAVYVPPVQVDPPPDDLDRGYPPSGGIAGVFARTDASRGVWRTPAGMEAALLGIRGVAIQLDASDLANLEAAGVNAIRTLPGSPGPVVWGARTIQGAEGSGSEFAYVPVRRFVSFIERSIDRGTRWAAFEPNDEPLWAALRHAVAAFLDDLFHAGAFPGSKPQDASFVRCDRTTMTQDDIDRGIVTIVVGVAPIRPAEFVVLRIGRHADRHATEQLGPASGAPAALVRLAHCLARADGFVLQVEGDRGWTAWSAIGELEAAGPDDQVYRLDPEAGEIRFGDGVHGAIPREGAGIEATYRYGSGRGGNEPC